MGLLADIVKRAYQASTSYCSCLRTNENQLAAIEAPTLPSLVRQLHAVEQAQQSVRRIRDVVLAGFPVMYSPGRHMKKLRAAMQIHAQASVHGAEILSKLGAGITVVTPLSELLF